MFTTHKINSHNFTKILKRSILPAEKKAINMIKDILTNNVKEDFSPDSLNINGHITKFKIIT